MPAEAITRVHKMAQLSPIGLVFGDQTNVIDDNDDNETYVPGRNLTMKVPPLTMMIMTKMSLTSQE